MTDLEQEAVEQAVTQEARDMNRDPITGAPGAHPVGTGIGAAGGAVAGAAVGLMGGPVGSAIGGVVGAVVGGLAGKGVGESVNPTADEVIFAATDRASDVPAPDEEDLYWQRAFITEPYYNKDYSYIDYAPAYGTGHADRLINRERSWDEAEIALQSEWERSKGASRLTWDEARQAMRAAWVRTDNAHSPSGPFGLD